MSVELPKDAEGREIPLDTTVLYDKDGKEVEVSRYQYYPKVGPGYWNLQSVRNKYYRQDEVYLTPPDSWEKLEEDLQRITADTTDWPCAYAGHDKRDTGCNSNCSNCKFFKDNRSCEKQAVLDIVSRISKLRGDTDA